MKLFHKKGENDEVDQLARRKMNLKLAVDRNTIKKLLYDDDDDDDEHINEDDAYDQIKND